MDILARVISPQLNFGAILGHHNLRAFLYLFPLVSGVSNSFRESL